MSKEINPSTVKKILLVIGFLVISAAIFVFWGGSQVAENTEVKQADITSKADGIYSGTYAINPVTVELEVTIKDKKITAIQIKRHINGMGGKAEGPVISAILQNQTNVADTVSGASVSSKTIMNAVWDALK